MHYLFVDISREIQAHREVKIYDPFFEQTIGQDDQASQRNNQSEIQENDQEIQISKPDNKKDRKELVSNNAIGSESKKRFLKDYDLNVLEVESFLFKDVSIMQNRQIQETLKHHIVYIFAIPCDFNHEGFLTAALENRYDQVHSIRILLDLNGEKQKKKSLILYFNDKDAADDFITEYNCYTINQKNEEYMLVISLQFITFIPRREQLQHAMEEQQKANLVELPNCPLCIEKLESQVSGFNFSIALNLFIYDEPCRWKQVKQACNTCMDKEIQECIQCQEYDIDGLWICFICGHMGCGRYKKGHAKEHWYSSGHCLSMEVESERIWDYFDDKFVHRIMKGENNKTIIMNNFEKYTQFTDQSRYNHNNGISQAEQQIGSEQEIILSRELLNAQQPSQRTLQSNGNYHMMMWDQWNDRKGKDRLLDSNDDKLNSDRVDNAIWEYCYVISHQMEEQRKYFEKKLEDVKRKNDEVQLEGEVSIIAVQDEIKQIKESREKIKKLREGNAKKSKTISDKNKDMESDIEELDLFINGIKNNIEHFQQKQAQSLYNSNSSSSNMSQSSSSSSSSNFSSAQTQGEGMNANNQFSSAISEEILQESNKLLLLEQQLTSLYDKLQQE